MKCGSTGPTIRNFVLSTNGMAGKYTDLFCCMLQSIIVDQALIPTPIITVNQELVPTSSSRLCYSVTCSSAGTWFYPHTSTGYNPIRVVSTCNTADTTVSCAPHNVLLRASSFCSHVNWSFLFRFVVLLIHWQPSSDLLSLFNSSKQQLDCLQVAL